VHRHIAPQFFTAATGLPPELVATMARNAPMPYAWERPMKSQLPARTHSATRGEVIFNWLALLVLLALVVV
jgi:hypothetical protein